MGRRVALVVILVSASHRVLDLVVHRPDMPVLPGNLMNLPYLGLAFWKDPQVPACLELILVIAGASLYWRTAREVSANSGRNATLAAISAATIGGFGALVLFLDYTS